MRFFGVSLLDRVPGAKRSNYSVLWLQITLSIGRKFTLIPKWRMMDVVANDGARLRTHSQNMTVAARQMAEKKTVGHLS